jgi:hypothetical protein
MHSKIKNVGNVKEEGYLMKLNSKIPTKKSWISKAALGLVAVFSVATLSFAGSTYAQGGGYDGRRGDVPSQGAPVSKDNCKRDGWKSYGFKNQGRCISWVNDHGYGGGNHGGQKPEASPWWHFNINGDNNVVNIVINYIFG